LNAEDVENMDTRALKFIDQEIRAYIEDLLTIPPA
jgi:hypothetical protein